MVVLNPRGGSYLDLVKAAEKCMAGVIHPDAMEYERGEPASSNNAPRSSTDHEYATAIYETRRDVAKHVTRRSTTTKPFVLLQRCFAVEDRGHFRGLITLRDVGAIPRDQWDNTTVGEVMRSLEELHTITPDTPVLDALKLMTANDVNQLPVVANGTLQGTITRSHLMQLLQAHSELQPSGARHLPFHRMNQKGLTP